MGKRSGLSIPWVLAAALAGAPSRGDDCNRNGLDDRMDLESTPVGFQPGLVVPGARAMGAGDIDRDGDRDVLVAGIFAHRLQLLENVDGKLTPARPLELVLDLVDRILVADVDGDGMIDVVSWSRSGPTGLSVFRGQPGGAFLPVSVSGFSSAGTSSVALGDLDRDGDMDLALALSQASPDPGLVVLRNANGAFAADPVTQVGTVEDIDLVDLDADGDLDAALATPFKALILQLDNGAPVGNPKAIAVGAGPLSIRAGDLDGDGDADLVTANEVDPGSISVLSNAGDGTFALPRNYAMGSDLQSLELADVDGDGDLDACVQGFEAGVFTALNDGSARFLDDRAHPFPGSILDMIVIDFEEDGRPDFSILDGLRSAVFTLENDGAGAFRWSPPPLRQPDAFSTGGPIHGIACTDLDADGDTDVAFARSGGLPGVLLNQGGRSFSSGNDFQLDFPLATRTVSADIDGRLGKDLALAALGRREIAIALHRGGLDFELTARAVDFQPTCLGVEDMDRDGRPDVVVGGYVPPGSPAACAVLLNDGQGGFPDALPFPTEAQPLALLASDLDRDGAPDVVLASFATGAAVVHWGKGDGSLEEPRSFATARGPAGLAGGDFDGDGLLDFAVACSLANTIQLFRNEAGRSFESVQLRMPHYNDLRAIAAADLNSDGLPEVVIADGTVGTTSLLRWLDGSLVVSIDNLGLVNCLAVEPSDIDGDGGMDLVFAQRNTPAAISISWNEMEPPVSADDDRDDVPDECRLDMPYRRGDANGEGVIDLADPLSILRSLFLGDPAPACLDAADADGDGRLSVADAIFLLLHLFQGGPPPAPPGPDGCGKDPHPPGSPRRLGCEAYGICG